MTTSWSFQSKPGLEGWAYDQTDLAYDAVLDLSNNSVQYDSTGTPTTWASQSKP